jgi:hypothetical protein
MEFQLEESNGEERFGKTRLHGRVTFRFMVLKYCVHMKNAVCWDITPCGSVLTRATRRNIPEDAIPHSHCRENLKPYIVCIL